MQQAVSLRIRAFGIAVAIGPALLAGAACATVEKPAHLSTLTPADLSSPVGWEYKIQIGDQLDIKFYYNSDLNEG